MGSRAVTVNVISCHGNNHLPFYHTLTVALPWIDQQMSVWRRSIKTPIVSTGSLLLDASGRFLSPITTSRPMSTTRTHIKPQNSVSTVLHCVYGAHIAIKMIRFYLKFRGSLPIQSRYVFPLHQAHAQTTWVTRNRITYSSLHQWEKKYSATSHGRGLKAYILIYAWNWK